jgi:hypothetical protein
MRTSGWIFLVCAWTFIIGLSAWTMWRILFGARGKQW